MIWMSFTMKGNKQDEKGQPNYERHKNELGQKENYLKDPLMGANGGLNNKQNAFKGVVTK